jgi:CubicO group peptidase (beta-lactamase class C family)
MLQTPALSADHRGSAALELLARLDQVRQQGNVPAMGLVIVQGDRVTLLETRGVKDRDTGEPIRDDAIIRIGSITKMFTGLLAAELAARRVVDLDSPVYNKSMAGTYSNSYRQTHPVTLAHLLEQTAGFTDMIPPEWDYSDPAQLPLQQTLRMYPEARVTQWPPGVHFSYTNAGAGLAARAGMPTATYQEWATRWPTTAVTSSSSRHSRGARSGPWPAWSRTT